LNCWLKWMYNYWICIAGPKMGSDLKCDLFCVLSYRLKLIVSTYMLLQIFIVFYYHFSLVTKWPFVRIWLLGSTTYRFVPFFLRRAVITIIFITKTWHALFCGHCDGCVCKVGKSCIKNYTGWYYCRVDYVMYGIKTLIPGLLL